jgi:hypothetical protein
MVLKMKTIFYQKMGKLEIILGFGDAVIDPVETNKIVEEKIKKTELHAAISAKKEEYAKASKEFIDAQKTRNQAKYEAAHKTMTDLQEDLKTMAIDYNKAIKDLRRSEAVYFEPKPGEAIIAQDEAKTLTAALTRLPEGDFLCRDGSIVTAEEYQKMRISALSPEKRAKEKGFLLERALSEASEMRSKLEIKGEKDALGQSQSFYEQKTKEIEALYG